jgi:hypothetical protein
MGVEGIAISSSTSSNSGLDRSTSGEGDSSRRRDSGSASSEVVEAEGALAVDNAGEMIARATACTLASWLRAAACAGSGNG